MFSTDDEADERNTLCIDEEGEEVWREQDKKIEFRDIEESDHNRSSCKGRKGNALALRADEGRDKLR